MKQEELTKMSLDELKKQEKTLTSTMAVLGGVLLVLIIAVLFLTVRKGFSVFSVLPIAFLPIFIATVANLKKIKEEIALRNS